jgi:heterodisulfide reductase subunit C
MTENASATTRDTTKDPIKASEINPKFKYELIKMHGSEKLLKCFQCGTCTSDLGLKDRVLKSDTLWLCAACFTCTDRCPQGVEVASVIRVLRNLAADEGMVPQVFKDQCTSVLESGYAYKIPDLRIKKRESLGLPPLPKGNPESVRKSLKGVKFVEKMEKKGESDAKQ